MYIGNAKSNLTAMVFIPHWVAEALQRHGLKLSDILNYDKVRPCLSQSDMAGLMAFQREDATLIYSGSFTGRQSAFPVGQELDQLWSYYTDTWPANEPGNRIEPLRRNRPSEDYDKTRNLSYMSSFSEDNRARLYGPDTRSERYDHAFDVVQLESNVAGVVIYPGFFDVRPDPVLQKQLVDALLKVFYAHAAFEEVAPTPLFKRRLELLSGLKS